jgi:hypothetical protein
MPDILLNLTGACIPQPAHTDVVKFSVPVRGSETKSITIVNRSASHWSLKPVIDNPYWTGADVIEIEAGQSKAYDLTFIPLEMNGQGDNGRHEGSVFFPLPDGSGLLYKLIGVADKPLSVANISREIPSKTNHIEILTVQNWLKKPQRFKVIIEFLVKQDFVTLKGPEFIDVPPLMTKDYKLSFYSYKEGQVTAKVTFKNEQNQEFSYWTLTFKSTPPGTISTLEMATNTRSACVKELSLYNPLPVSVVFNSACNHTEISVAHAFTVPAR